MSGKGALCGYCQPLQGTGGPCPSFAGGRRPLPQQHSPESARGVARTLDWRRGGRVKSWKTGPPAPTQSCPLQVPRPCPHAVLSSAASLGLGGSLDLWMPPPPKLQLQKQEHLRLWFWSPGAFPSGRQGHLGVPQHHSHRAGHAPAWQGHQVSQSRDICGADPPSPGPEAQPEAWSGEWAGRGAPGTSGPSTLVPGLPCKSAWAWP